MGQLARHPARHRQAERGEGTVVAGGVGAWIAQGKHRKRERRYKKEADSLRFEVEDTKRKAGTDTEAGKSLVLSR